MGSMIDEVGAAGHLAEDKALSLQAATRKPLDSPTIKRRASVSSTLSASSIASTISKADDVRPVGYPTDVTTNKHPDLPKAKRRASHTGTSPASSSPSARKARDEVRAVGHPPADAK